MQSTQQKKGNYAGNQNSNQLTANKLKSLTNQANSAVSRKYQQNSQFQPDQAPQSGNLSFQEQQSFSVSQHKKKHKPSCSHNKTFDQMTPLNLPDKEGEIEQPQEKQLAKQLSQQSQSQQPYQQQQHQQLLLQNQETTNQNYASVQNQSQNQPQTSFILQPDKNQPTIPKSQIQDQLNFSLLSQQNDIDQNKKGSVILDQSLAQNIIQQYNSNRQSSFTGQLNSPDVSIIQAQLSGDQKLIELSNMIKQLKKEVIFQNEDKQLLQKDVSRLDKIRIQQEQKINVLKSDVNNFEQEIHQLKLKEKNYELQFQGQNLKIEVFQKQIENEKQDASQLQKKIKQLQEQNDQLQQQNLASSKQFQQQKLENEKLAIKYDNSMQEEQTKMEFVQQRMDELLKDLQEAKFDATNTKQLLENERNITANLKDELRKVKSQLEEREELQQQILRKKKYIQDLEEEVDRLKGIIRQNVGNNFSDGNPNRGATSSTNNKVVKEKIIEKPIFIEKVNNEQIQNEQKLKLQNQELNQESRELKDEVKKLKAMIQSKTHEIQQCKSQYVEYENLIKRLDKEKQLIAADYEDIIAKKNDCISSLSDKQNALISEIQFLAQKNIDRNQDVRRSFINKDFRKNRVITNQNISQIQNDYSQLNYSYNR